MGVRAGARRLAGITRVPDARSRSWVAPSGAAALIECKLRVAFASDSGHGARIGSPATRLGNTCHAALQQAALGRLGAPDDSGWRDKFEGAWNAALEKEVREVRELAPPRPWPSPERWPFYAPRKAATRRIARELSREAADPGFDAAAEEPQQSADGVIRGQPDLVVRRPVHEIRDYKTGAVVDEAGAPRAAYALQVQLYAVMERHASGSWPDRGVLVPLPGEAVTVDVDAAAAARAAEAAASALEQYNRAVAGGSIDGLGAPSPEACRYCEFAPECPAFWDAWEPAWSGGGLLAVAGEITAVRQVLRGGLSVDVQPWVGTGEAEPVTIHHLDPLALPQTEWPEEGVAAAFVGLRQAGSGHAEATPWTRLALRGSGAQAPRVRGG